jgi:hypothetical protein
VRRDEERNRRAADGEGGKLGIENKAKNWLRKLWNVIVFGFWGGDGAERGGNRECGMMQPSEKGGVAGRVKMAWGRDERYVCI